MGDSVDQLKCVSLSNSFKVFPWCINGYYSKTVLKLVQAPIGM